MVAERALGVVVRSHAEVHVVVARDVEERNAARGQRLVHGVEEGRTTGDVTDDVAADKPDGRNAVRRQAADVGRCAAQAVELAVEVDLRVGDDHHAVALRRAGRGFEREVVSGAGVADAPVEACRRTLLGGHLVSIGERDVYEVRFGGRRHQIVSRAVGAHDRAAVRDGDSCHALAGGRHAAAQVDRARLCPAAAPCGGAGRQRRDEYVAAQLHCAGSMIAAQPPPGAIGRSIVSLRVTSHVRTRKSCAMRSALMPSSRTVMR